MGGIIPSSSNYGGMNLPHPPRFRRPCTLCFCNNFDALMGPLGVQHIPSEWHFIDSSKSSIKAVLLHNVNLLPSIPIAYSENLRESHETMIILIEHIKYDTYNWPICGDLKVIGLLWVCNLVKQSIAASNVIGIVARGSLTTYKRTGLFVTN